MSNKGQNMDEMKLFDTITKGEQGVKLELIRPDGEKTNHYLNLISSDTREARVVKAKCLRELSLSLKNENLTDEEKTEIFDNAEIQKVSALIKGWSFKKECNNENKKAWLKLCPSVVEQINRFCSDRENFFFSK